jgi:hypothetical protein
VRCYFKMVNELWKSLVEVSSKGLFFCSNASLSTLLSIALILNPPMPTIFFAIHSFMQVSNVPHR